ncbi:MULTISPECIES: NADP(H)-dependent aldo-keto reductase [Halomonas]|uniref:NADP(H)-dependent aldo-keto reductase n=1 Tax=Halomonas TaxID=2745 RepID=UPI001A8C90DD|nr:MULTISPECIES: NADP(H)-dependent aldo-keto reductase [Halomonas]MEE3214577.1 NADP(H)-dependent aldo-keto reductase [Pseudomonadota bacterium]MBN8411928.1 NADP(H)-dependent aldo-keto reductase [Halomonas litopenaei]MBY5970057.1 NADP(H)-dependent aldo-keto reductase [Halomonas denitrificans]MBY6030227.1 NADP(H)-dependent aldo-keto reductase [Halomonas sp. DP8Y7-1]MBY6209851.1 NADP(H)-dependent aldo-keto reductase [Halomonas sp. DP3Y7-2]
MQTRPLGTTGIDVSRICLGTMTFGEQNTEAEAHAQLDRAVAFGVNFIDAAEMYPVPPKAETQGLTESYIGSWLKGRQSRDDVVIATKAAGPGISHIRGGPRLDRQHLHEAIDGSLSRLNTDYVDLYQLHWPDRSTNFFGRLGYTHDEDEQATALEETLSALKELVDAGKVRAIGVSNETPWGVMRCLKLADTLGVPRVASIQNPYSLLNRTFEVGLAEIAQREQVGLLAYSPLAFGVLTGKYLNGARPEGARLTLWDRFSRYSSEQATAATEAYVALAREHGLDPGQMALAYVNSRSFLTSNIIGATTMDQLESNLASEALTLSEEVLEGIEAIHQRIPNPSP